MDSTSDAAEKAGRGHPEEAQGRTSGSQSQRTKENGAENDQAMVRRSDGVCVYPDRPRSFVTSSFVGMESVALSFADHRSLIPIVGLAVDARFTMRRSAVP
jgi:hypothetical protein